MIYLLFFTFYSPIQTPARQFHGTDTLHTIYVVSHGWHTGIVIDSDDLPPAFKNQPSFPEMNHIEFGWGDREFYKHPDPGIWLTARAALLPTPSVMHVVGFNRETKDYFPFSSVTAIDLKRANFTALMDYILNSFEEDSSGLFIPQGEGLYGNSRFFTGSQPYIFPKTCNVWTAACLKAAGIDISPLRYQRASSLMLKLESLSQHNHYIRGIRSNP